MKKEYKYHYVYRITNIVTGYHYYGSKSCNEKPIENIGKKYFSNSTVKLFIQDQKNNPQDYKYKVIKTFETSREDAMGLEVKLHKKFDVKSNPKFINKANQTSKKFDTAGSVSTKNQVTVIDENGNTFNILKSDTRWVNGELVSVNKGRVNVKDGNGINHCVSVDDPRYLSGELIPLTKGYKHTNQTKLNMSKSQSGKKLSQETKDKMKGRITSGLNIKIFNKNDECIFDCPKGTFTKICRDNNLPVGAFRNSYRKNGSKLYQSQDAKNATKKENLVYEGWYALELS